MPRRRNRRAANQIVQNAGANVPNGAPNGPNAGLNGQNNPENAENGEKLTPYQGSFRSFGKFRCTDCNRVWASACSWANIAQKCFQCKIYIYPFMQLSLKSKKKNESKHGKPHPKELCQKCQDLGFFCGQSSPKKKKNKRRNRSQKPNGVAAGV